ncbi:phospholipid-binding lipoprotein MlaA [Gammaproteobacteria bacterium]
MKLKNIIVILAFIAFSVPVSAATGDPFESFNRAIFSFNRSFLEHVVEPSVNFISPRLPESVITAGKNIYSNFTEIEFLLNGLLVGDPKVAAISAGRFVTNFTLGLGGIFDVAKHFGLNRVESNFIESLCQTGLAPGPYVVFPLVGPGNLYSGTALVAGIAAEVYLLSFISTTLALADFLIIDVAGTASSLRYMRDLPLDAKEDPYLVQKTDHLKYVRRTCEQEILQ